MGRLLQMDAGKMELKCAEFNLWGCLDYCIEMLAMRCESKGLDLSYNMDESVPECVLLLFLLLPREFSGVQISASWSIVVGGCGIMGWLYAVVQVTIISDKF